MRHSIYQHALAVSLAALSLVFGAGAASALEPVGTTEATWYGYGFSGRRTASGEMFNPLAFTAAHPSLPLGTVLEVRRPGSDDAVIVRINDRCRCKLDLTKGAADAIGMVRAGRAQVRYVVLHGVSLPAPATAVAPMFADVSVIGPDIVY